MLEIVLISLMLIMMAKPRRRRRRWTADMQAVQVFHVLAFGALASSTLIGVNMLAAGDNEYRLLTIKGLWSIRDLTVGEGPLIFGVAHSDYTDAEIEEFLETETMLTRGNMVATREIGRRLVRRIGIFTGNAAEETINDGKPVYTRLNWPMATAIVPKLWIYNASGATLTTGAEISFHGKFTIRWT